MKCPKCGAEVSGKFCSECGTSLQNEEQKAQERKFTSNYSNENQSECNKSTLTGQVTYPQKASKFSAFMKKVNSSQYSYVILVSSILVLLLIFGGVYNYLYPTNTNDNSSSYEEDYNDNLDYEDYSICGLSLSVPSDWDLNSDEKNACFFYPNTEKNTMFMVYKDDENIDFDINENYVIDSLIEGYFDSKKYSNEKEIKRKIIEIDEYNAVRLDYSFKLEGKSMFTSIYFTIYNSKLYGFIFQNEGNKTNEVFKNTQNHIINSIVFDDDDTKTTVSTEAPKIEYEEVTLKKLYNNYFEYNNEYVKTTIKVTKINKDDAEYSYTVYDTNEFDKVTVKFKNVYPKKKKIKKGGYLTVEGLCNYKEYDYNSKLTITVDADRRVPKDKSLFKKLGAEKKTPQEYLNALEKAKSYSDNLHMSKKAIYEQLTSEYGENFTADAAQYAVDNLVADYNQNALEKAKSYYKDMNMSKQLVYEQLISEYGEQFTSSEAQYAIDHLDD